MKQIGHILFISFCILIYSCTNDNEELSINTNNIFLYLDYPNLDKFKIQNSKGNCILDIKDESIISAEMRNDSIKIVPLKLGRTILSLKDQNNILDVGVYVNLAFDRKWFFSKYEFKIECDDIETKQLIENELKNKFTIHCGSNSGEYPSEIESSKGHVILRSFINNKLIEKSGIYEYEKNELNQFNITYNDNTLMRCYYTIEKDTESGAKWNSILTHDLTDYFKKIYFSEVKSVTIIYHLVYEKYS